MIIPALSMSGNAATREVHLMTGLRKFQEGYPTSEDVRGMWMVIETKLPPKPWKA
jgi:hypothetical protein